MPELMYSVTNNESFDITLSASDGEGLKIPAGRTVIVPSRFVATFPTGNVKTTIAEGDDLFIPRSVRSNPDLITMLSIAAARALSAASSAISAVFNTKSITLAANGSFVVPAGYRINSIDAINTTANAVTGGLKFGTTAGGTDIVAALAVGANAIVTVADAALLKKVFSKTVDQTIYVQPVTAWNNASVDLSIALVKAY